MDETSFSSLRVYKFRRRKDQEVFLKKHPNIQTRESSSNVPQPSVLHSEPGRQHFCKTFAVLTEPRTEYKNKNLRYTLLIYSNPAWKAFVLTILLICFVLNTYTYAFLEHCDRPFWIIILLICLNFVFIFDVGIVVGLKFFRKWRKTLNLMEPDIYKVVFDIILAVPYSALYLMDVRGHYVPFSQGLKIRFDSDTLSLDVLAPIVAGLRMYRIIEYFYHKASQAGSNQWTTFLFQYLTLLFLACHGLACIWYLFAYTIFDIHNIQMAWSNSANDLPTETTFDWYFLCMYWASMFLSTNCLGDIYPVTTQERIAASLAILLGFFLSTIVLVGSLTSLFLTITMRRSQYVMQLQKIKNYLDLIKMDKSTSKRILGYYEDLWYQKSGVFKPKLMKLLPYPLQMEICYDLNAVPLYSSLIFRKLPEFFLRRLSLSMTHQFYLPGDIVYSQDSNKTVMICITNGVLELLSDEDDESPMISFTKGTCLGEIALVYNIPARCTVKAATYVECQVLEKSEFIKVMITYPDLIDSIRREIDVRIERCKARKRKDVRRNEIIALNIYASRKTRKSSIKCLKDKLRFIQGKSDEDLSKNDYLDMNCLDLYVLSRHMKKKTNEKICLTSSFPWILERDCTLVRYWEMYMLVIVFYISIVYPYFVGFKRELPGGVFFYIEVVINVTLVMNNLITTITAVKTKNTYIRNFKGIVNYRLRTLGFYLDLIAVIPFEYLVTIHSDVKVINKHLEHLYYVSKLSKLCLVWRISSFSESMEKKLMCNSILIKVPKYIVYLSLMIYWAGVILFMEACFISRCSTDCWLTKSLTVKIYKQIARWNGKATYPVIASMYFSTTLVLAVGYGDFTPGDQYDMGLVAFITIYGVLLTGYCVAEFSAVTTHLSRTKTTFLEVIITIEKFMKENNMHHNIKKRIMAFYELQWQYNAGVELTGENWLEKTVIPAELRKKVLHQARFKTLTSIKFFQVKNKSFIHTLTEMAKDVILPPGEIVYYGGTISRELYIIESGYCVINSIVGEKKIKRVIGPGNHLGLLTLLYGVPAVNTVVTLTHCKLISIGHAAFSSALSLFPDMREHDGLLTPNEMKFIYEQAKSKDNQAYTNLHRCEMQKSSRIVKITNLFQQFINDSFINVLSNYRLKKQSYLDSYRELKVISNFVPYLLLPIVMRPNGIFLKIWAFTRVITAFLLCLLTPIEISVAPTTNLFNNTMIILELICYVDIYLMLHVAFYGSMNQLIYHPYLTAKNYLSRGFLIDFLCCFPWYALVKLFLPKHDEGHTILEHYLNPHVLHCMARMVNILQIYKLHAAFWAESIAALKRAYLMSVVQFLLLMVFFLNFYSCLLLIMTCRYVRADNRIQFESELQKLKHHGPLMSTKYSSDGNMVCLAESWITEQIKYNEPVSPFKAFLLAFYWTAISFSGAGFGDITAKDLPHMVLSICVMLHGVFFFGYVYAKIASLKAMADQVMYRFQEKLKHLEIFLSREKVPIGIRRTVMDYWKYQWKRTGGWSHQSILGKLHANLNEDAVLFMYEKTLREIPLFEDVEYSFFRVFAKKLKEQYFQKGYVVMRANEVVSNMYIIYRGKVDILSEENEVETCMGPGGIFGNIRGAYKYLTMSNIVASRNIDLLVIDGPAFYSLLKSYPSALQKVSHSVNTAYKDYVLPTIAGDRLSSTVHYPHTYETGEDDEDEDDDHLRKIESPERSIGDSHGSKSLTSVTYASELIDAALLIFLPHRWFRKSIVPDSKWMTFMEYLTLFLSYVDFMILIYQMAFQSNPYFLNMCIVSDIIFLYKLFLDFHCGYMNRYGDYVLGPTKVRKMFFSNVLHRRRDFLANLHLSYFAFILNVSIEMQMALFCYLRTPQLLRLSYLFTYRTHRKINIGTNLILKMTKIGIWTSILTHINACLFYKLSCLTHIQCVSGNWMSKSELFLRGDYNKENYFTIYITSLWYMINLLTIAGTGDVSAQNDFEIVETTILIIIMKFCVGLLISEMSSMISAHSLSRIAYDYGINELRDGLRDMGLSSHQMDKMWDYVCRLWNRQQGKQMPDLVYELPFRLRCLVLQAAFAYHINESLIFDASGEEFRRMLVMWMRHCVFFPGNYIVQCGDSDQCIYFIHRGEVEVLTVHQNLTESIYDILGPEDSFGVAQGLFVGVSHHFSFRARTVVDVVYLKLDQWKYLLDFYPKSAKIVQRKVENVYLSI